MECEHIRERILETFDSARFDSARFDDAQLDGAERDDARGDMRTAPVQPPDVAAHLDGCAACRAFAAAQQALDARLSAMFVAPDLSPAFRQDLRARIRAERRPNVWYESLPDIVHFTSCGLATLWCAYMLPLDPLTVAGAGATTALVSYALLTAVRQSLESAECSDA